MTARARRRYTPVLSTKNGGPVPFIFSLSSTNSRTLNYRRTRSREKNEKKAPASDVRRIQSRPSRFPVTSLLPPSLLFYNATRPPYSPPHRTPLFYRSPHSLLSHPISTPLLSMSSLARSRNVGLDLTGKVAAVAGGTQVRPLPHAPIRAADPGSPGDRSRDFFPLCAGGSFGVHHWEERRARGEGGRAAEECGRGGKDVRVYQGRSEVRLLRSSGRARADGADADLVVS